MRLILLALISLLLYGCRSIPRKVLPPLPPLPKAQVQRASSVSRKPTWTPAAQAVHLEWQEGANPVQIQASTNLNTWEDWASITNAASVEIPTVLQSQYFKVVAQNCVTLEWNPSPPPVTGYRLFVGPASGNYTNSYDAGLSTSYTFPLAPGSTIFCALQAYSRALASDFSNEVTWTAPTTWITPVPMRIRVY